MIIECIAILAVLGILIFMIARAGRQTVALALLPLLLVPLSYLLSIPLSSFLSSLTGLPRFTLAAGVLLLGLIAAGLLFGMLCGNFRSRRMQRAYLGMCSGFSVILAMILVNNLFVTSVL